MDETTNTQNQMPVVTSQSDSEVVNFLINRGLVKSEGAAKVLIVVLCLLIATVSLYFAFSDGGDVAQLPEGAKMIEIPGQPPRLEMPISQPTVNTDTEVE